MKFGNQSALSGSFVLFLNAKALAGPAMDRHCPDMKPTLILITERHKQFKRGAYPCDDCCQTFDPIEPGARTFAAGRKWTIVLSAFLRHNVNDFMPGGLTPSIG